MTSISPRNIIRIILRVVVVNNGYSLDYPRAFIKCILLKYINTLIDYRATYSYAQMWRLDEPFCET